MNSSQNIESFFIDKVEFANGAVTAAFVYMFNDSIAAHSGKILASGSAVLGAEICTGSMGTGCAVGAVVVVAGVGCSMSDTCSEMILDLKDKFSNLIFDEGKTDTLAPGPNAGDSIPARGPGRDFTPAERDQVNGIGQETGCHTCGSTNPRTKSGNFIPDHQPPSALNPSGDSQQLYPHCLSCSRIQGGQVRGAKK